MKDEVKERESEGQAIIEAPCELNAGCIRGVHTIKVSCLFRERVVNESARERAHRLLDEYIDAPVGDIEAVPRAWAAFEWAAREARQDIAATKYRLRRKQ